MSENEKKNEGQSCCCKCWKTIFIAIALLAIGAVFGHMMSMRYPGCPMRGLCGDSCGMKACWDRGDRVCGGGLEHKCRGGKEVCGEQKGLCGDRDDAGKCKPGCTCPMCSKKAACLSDPNKASCPMMDKKEGKPEKY